MKIWFLGLNQREQLSVMILTVVLGLYVLYMFAWSPLADRRNTLGVQNAAVTESLGRVDAMVSELLSLRKNGAESPAKRNLTSLISQSTRNLKLSVSRLQPNSRGEVQVRLENASFDDLLTWLHQMEYRDGLLVHEVSITESGSVGRVNATVRIGEAR
ncbi:MAG: general secretion pathway protein M [Bacteroidia bacterium]|jgi:general secretion pathway protein M